MDGGRAQTKWHRFPREIFRREGDMREARKTLKTDSNLSSLRVGFRIRGRSSRTSSTDRAGAKITLASHWYCK